MNKTMFEFMLEQHFEDFELGDAIQVHEDYIYFEFQMNYGDRKMRIPFVFEDFKRALEAFGVGPKERDFYIVLNISEIKTEILKRLLDLKEEDNA